MKRCPTCRTVADDAALYCDLDGTPLVAAVVRHSMAPASAEWQASKDTSGKGIVIGGHAVTAEEGPDVFLANDADGLPLRLVVGEPKRLALEADALRACLGTPGVPELVELGDDGRRGPFLAIGAPDDGAMPLASAAAWISLATVGEVTRAALRIAAIVESRGFVWHPSQRDLLVRADGTLVLTRLRTARRLGEGERMDARPVLGALALSVVPEPSVRGTKELVKIFSAATLGLAYPLSIEDASDAVQSAVRATPDPGTEPGVLGVMSDRGLAKDENEDAVATEVGELDGEPWAALVVCDGVSSSENARIAATVAATTARDALARFAKSGALRREAPKGAVVSAIHAAHRAVARLAESMADFGETSTTIVVAFVHKRTLTVAWLGDSRCYWNGERDAELLTRDHTWANEAVHRGTLSEADAEASPNARALARCLGRLESGEIPEHVEAEVRVRELPSGGHVILCTDGLCRYTETPRALRDFVRSAGPSAPPVTVARVLQNHALARGGHDNVTVVVYGVA